METIPAKKILQKTKSTAWFGCDYNMNLYRGCCHGCIYCDSRSDCYRNPDFEHIKIKQNALEILRNDLRGKVKQGVVATGSMSDPYNPFEARELCTRKALELLSAFGFGVAIATKSPLVARDIDILKEIKEHSPVIVKITITTANEKLCSRIEPHAPPVEERFDALKKLAEAGIFCGVLLMPLLPFLNDTEQNVLEIARRTSEAGANFIYPGFGVTLRDSQRAHFYYKLDEEFPGIRQKYVSRYGNRYSCAVPRVKALHKIFVEECKNLGLLTGMRDIVAGYKMGYEQEQISLFAD